jgi:two-component system sensor histidine kinase TctE
MDAPLHALQRRIHDRPPDDLSPLIPSQAPAEIAPLVSAFNELLVRLDQNAVIQKRFIAQAAHQMKTPLAGLRMQAELALRQPISAEVQRSLELIATSSGQAARLVTQLLSLARAENTAQRRDIAPVDMHVLAQSVVGDWVGAALDKGMDLGYEYGPDSHMNASSDLSSTPHAASHSTPDAPSVPMLSRPPPPLAQGDAVLLREMLTNLIDNAIRYTAYGGRITVRLLLVPDATPSHIVMEVEDNGPGIAQTERGRVIERFYRILGREGDGSGLGLAIVHEIVTAHAGTLAIMDPMDRTPAHALTPSSCATQGTLVRVQLPLHTETSQFDQNTA